MIQDPVAQLQAIANNPSVTQSNIKFLNEVAVTEAVKQELYQEFEHIEEIPNQEWLAVLFVKFSYMTQIFNCWQQILDIQIHSEFVAEFLLDDALGSTNTSWVTSSILVSNNLNEHLQFTVIQRFYQINGESKIEKMISDNRDFTGLINVLSLTKLLKLYATPTSDLIQFIHSRNPIFKNLYQLEQTACAEVRELNKSFASDGLIFVQVVSNALILWDNHHSNFKLNLNNLTKYALTSSLSVKMTFRKLSRFDTINYKINNFDLSLRFKNGLLVPSFMNKLKYLAIFKTKKISINSLPLKLVTLSKQVEVSDSRVFKGVNPKASFSSGESPPVSQTLREVNINSILDQRQPSKKLKLSDNLSLEGGVDSSRKGNSQLTQTREEEEHEITYVRSRSASIEVVGLIEGSPAIEETGTNKNVEEINSDDDTEEEDLTTICWNTNHPPNKRGDGSSEGDPEANRSPQTQNEPDHQGNDGKSNPPNEETGNQNEAVNSNVLQKNIITEDITAPLDEGTTFLNSQIHESISLFYPATSSSNYNLPPKDKEKMSNSLSIINRVPSNSLIPSPGDRNQLQLISSSLTQLPSNLIEKMNVFEAEVLQYENALTNQLNETITKVIQQHDTNLNQLNRFLQLRQQELFKLYTENQ